MVLDVDGRLLYPFEGGRAVITGKNISIMGVILFVPAFVAFLTFSKELIELSWFASETFVTQAVAEPIKQVEKLADDVLALKRQQLSTSEAVLDGGIAAAQINLINVNQRLREDPGNADAQRVKQITDAQLSKMLRQRRIVECELQKIERPHLPCLRGE